MRIILRTNISANNANSSFISFFGLRVIILSKIIGNGVKITTSIIWLVTMTLESKVNVNYT